MQALFCLPLLLILNGGCSSSEANLSDPPLRPLLYTEVTSRVEGGIPGFDEWLATNHDPLAWPAEGSLGVLPTHVSVVAEPRTADELMLAVFEALLSEDARLLQSLVFTPEAYMAAARTNEGDAQAAIDELQAGVRTLLEQFESPSESQSRPDGLRGLIEAGQITVGRGRNIDGSSTTADQIPVMHWNSEMIMRLRDTEVEFVLRFPKVLVGADGMWRLAAAPSVDGRFQAFRSLGMDLKPEMMSAQHSAFPLSVGNYWHYRTIRPLSSQPQEGNSRAVNQSANNGYRDEVIQTDDHLGYRVVRLRRLFDDPNRPSQLFAWLVTPLRIYSCSRDCQRSAEDTSWILNYAQNQVPLIVLPALPGSAWGTGGHDTEHNVWRIDPERQEIVVPSGTFPEAVELSRSVAGGQQFVYFAPGVGFVMRRNNAGLQTEDEELIDYRIMP
jgi:hypothetical protein